jgi:transmembrane 9 superfamily protein 2/4
MSVCLSLCCSYNRVPQEDFDKDSSPMNEDYGWKLIHADVFRPPSTYPMLYCVIVGTGVQLYICILGIATISDVLVLHVFYVLLIFSLASILFAAIGFLSPTNRGSIMITLLMIFVLCGSLAGM